MTVDSAAGLERESEPEPRSRAGTVDALPAHMPGWLWVAGILWCAACVAGVAAMMLWELRAGAAGGITGPPPAALGLTAGRRHLVLAIHPSCPCTRSTLANLRSALTAAPGIEVVVLRSGPDAGDRVASDIARGVASLHPVRIVDDPDGSLAAAIGATSSGTIIVYDAMGIPKWSGGVTASRGMSGDCRTLRSLEDVLRDPSDQVASSTAPVFGCPLRTLDASPAKP